MQHKQDNPQYLRLSLAPRFEGFEAASAVSDRAHRRLIVWMVTLAGLILSAMVLFGT